MSELTTEAERDEHRKIMARLAELDHGKLTKEEAKERRSLERRRNQLLEIVRERRRAVSSEDRRWRNGGKDESS